MIQSKQSSRANWRVDGFIALLKHGKTRESAAARLKREPRTRYVLVTNAPATDTLRPLCVKDFLARPNPGSASANLRTALPESHGRVSLMINAESNHIELYVKELLLERCLVPHRRWLDCFQALRRDALAKMTAPLTIPWTRSEIEAVIRDHDGLLAASSEAELYVPPISRKAMRDALLSRHGVVIAGISGTGKTATAESLWFEMRSDVPGIERRVVMTARDLKESLGTGPILFDIEDPWGKYRFDPPDATLGRVLPDVLANRHPQHYYVVTSRTDVLSAAKAEPSVMAWIVPLEPEHYGKRERIEMYRKRADRLPFALASLANKHRDRVLRDLETPLEIQKFFVALQTQAVKDPRANADLVHDAIAFAHRKSIVDNVRAQIEERQAHRWAIVLWALFKGKRDISRAVFPAIQRRLAKGSRDFEEGLEPLLNFFVAARNLRQKEDVVSYAHPRVEEALEEVLKEEPLRSEAVIAGVIDAVMQSDSVLGGPDLAIALAARIAAAASGHEGIHLALSDDSQRRFDSWMEQRLLLGNERDLEDTLRLAEAIGSSNSEVMELARFIATRATSIWGPSKASRRDEAPEPLSDSAWLERMQASEGVRQLAARFVRHVLPDDRRHFRPRLAIELQRIAGDLGDAFRDAAASIVSQGYGSNSDVIIAGALQDLDRFEPVAMLAIEYLGKVEHEPDREQLLQIVNGELNEDHEQHLIDEQGDDGYSAREILTAYASRLRAIRGWEALRDHPRADALAWHWCQVLESDKDPPSPRELAALAAACWNNDGEPECYELFVRQGWQYPRAPTATQIPPPVATSNSPT